MVIGISLCTNILSLYHYYDLYEIPCDYFINKSIKYSASLMLNINFAALGSWCDLLRRHVLNAPFGLACVTSLAFPGLIYDGRGELGKC